MDDKVNFYKHCDEEDCCLGHAEYNCPNCQGLNEDFGDLWFEFEQQTVDRIVLDSCQKCGCGLVAKYNKNYGWLIKTLKQ